MPETRWTAPPAPPTDLERIEGLLSQLAHQMSSTPKAAAHAIRALDTDRRDRLKSERDPVFKAQVRVGPAREREISLLLKRAGWTLRETVDRKLPLTRLPADLKPLVRSGKLEPLKALLVNRVKNKLTRADLLTAVLEGRYSTRALENAISTKSRTRKNRHSSTEATDPQLDADLRWLETEITRHFGVKARLSPTALTLECGTPDGLNDLLEQLGVMV